MSESTNHPTHRFSELIDGVLDGGEQREIQAHLLRCSECRLQYQQLLALQKMMKGPVRTPPESFYRGIAARMSEADKAISEGGDRRNPESSRWWWGDPYKTAVSLGVVAIVVVAVYKNDPLHVFREFSPVPASRVVAPSTEDRLMSPIPASVPASNDLKSEVSQAKHYEPSDLGDSPVAPKGSAVSKNVMGALKDREAARAAVNGVSVNAFAGKPELSKKTVSDSDKEEYGYGANGLAVMQAQAPASLAEKSAMLESAGTRSLSSTAARTGAPIQEWKGNISRIISPRTVVIKTDDEWKTLWAEHTLGMIPAPPRPAVDFAHQMVIGVFAGSEPTAGYSISINSVVPESSSISVGYQIQSPVADNAAAVVTQPYHLRVVPTSPLPVEFKKS